MSSAEKECDQPYHHEDNGWRCCTYHGEGEEACHHCKHCGQFIRPSKMGEPCPGPPKVEPAGLIWKPTSGAGAGENERIFTMEPAVLVFGGGVLEFLRENEDQLEDK